jgi:hypothetical protein
MSAAGRKLGLSSSTLWRSRSHSQSETSLLRPRTLRRWRALTSTTSSPCASRSQRLDSNRRRSLPSPPGLDPALYQPVGELVEVGGERPKGAHRLRIPIGRHCHVVVLRAAMVPAASSWMRSSSGVQRECRSWGCRWRAALGGCLLFTCTSSIVGFDGWRSRTGGLGKLTFYQTGSPPGMSPMTLSLHPMDHALKRALIPHQRMTSLGPPTPLSSALLPRHTSFLI